MGFIKELKCEQVVLGGKVDTKSSIKTKWNGAEFKLKHGLNGNKMSMELEYKKWELKYDVPTRDTEVEWKTKIKPGELKIKQKIPQARFFLMPSPEFTLKAKPVNKKNLTAEIQPSYSLLDRKAKVEASLEFNKQHKLKLEADSRSGPRHAALTASTKPKGGLAKAAKQLSVKYSVGGGATLTHEFEPAKQFQLKSVLGLKAQDLKLTADIKPGKVAGVKPKITLESKVTAKAPTKPSLTASLTLDL